MLSEKTLPIPVKKALRSLGKDLKIARIRRRISMPLMAERASISRTTLAKIEKGDPSVSFGSYVTIIFLLGMISHLEILFKSDEVGLALSEESLPRRIRMPSIRKS